jgi:PAS domain S-box-containing protein
MQPPRDATEREQREEALPVSEERFRALAENVPLLVWTLTAEKQCDYVNPQFTRYTGLPEESFLGTWRPDLGHPDDIPGMMAAWKRGMSANVPVEFEVRMRRHDGAWRWFQVQVVPLRDAHGQVIKWFGINTDIDDRKHAEEKICSLNAEMQARLDEMSTLLEILPTGVWIGNRDCSQITGNPAAYKMMGLHPGINVSVTNPHPEVPEGMRIFVNGAEVPPEDAPMQQVARAGKPLYNFEHELLFPDGTRKTIYGSAAPLFDQQGIIRKVIGAYADFSDRKRAEESLRRSEALLAEAQALAHIGSWNWDVKTGAFHWSDEHYRVFGFEPREPPITLDRAWNRVHPEDRARVQELFAQAMEERRPYESIFRLLLDDGTVRIVQSRGRPAVDEAGELARMFGTIQDITERKRTEEALRQAHDELEARVRERTAELAQANEALHIEAGERRRAEEARTELLRRLATAQEDERGRISRELHDQVGQGLTALILSIKALRDSSHGPASDPASLERLQKRAEEIGRELHDLALRLRPTALDDLGLQAALQSAVDEWSRRSGIEVDYHSSGLAEQRLTEEMETALYRVVLEALNNILKHAQARRVSVILERFNNYAVAIVEDDGAGFDAEATLSSPPPGRLGLLGMRERIALVGGTLEIESTRGAGTTVFARIPLATQVEVGPP